MIQLKQVNDAILNALRSLHLRNMTMEDRKLMVDVVDPEEENPAMVHAIDAAGGDIVSVSVVSSTLEDAYLKLVKEQRE